MPVSLDTLLFWSGLGLLIVGLFVFITGKRASDESKKESSRFEAFGIKIDVSNPSMILIMLGVVMMLAPKFLPQEAKQTYAGSDQAVRFQPDSTAVGERPQMATTPKPTAEPELPLPTPGIETGAASLPAASGSQTATAKPKVVSTRPVAPPARSLPQTAPSPKSTSSQPLPPVAQPRQKSPPPEPQSAAPEPAIGLPEQSPVSLVVAVAADVSSRAGIRESAEAYARRAGDEIAQRAEDIFRNGMTIGRHSADDLRDHLQKGAEDYSALCADWQADILILGDFKITTVWTSMDSAYWPDYHLHLYNCETQNSRYEVFKHLNPSNQDAFPFEQAINLKTMKFLSDSRWLVGG